MRRIRQEVFPNHKFIIMTNPAWHPFIADFVSYTIDFPDWFKDIPLDQDSYEAVLPNSPSGSLTPPDIYSGLISYLKTLYNNDKGRLILPPRGCNFVLDKQEQIFAKYTHVSPLTNLGKPIIAIIPRKRGRAANRNVPEFVWRETVEIFRKNFTVVLLGTPEGAGLHDVVGDGIINLIPYIGEDKVDLTIQYLNAAICSISSQSGGTHISLLSGCPSYIIGHERDRHAVKENRLSIPISFRYVADYRCIDAQTIYEDVTGFVQQLQQANYYQQQTNLIRRPALWPHLKNKKDLVGVEIGVYEGLNSLNILKALDIKKLYLVDPYNYHNPIAGIKLSEKAAKRVQDIAEGRLRGFSNKTQWIYKSSEEAIEKIEDGLDFIYVDGNHTYEVVKKDIELYYPKLKEGGIIAFHDFDFPDDNNGVIQAVEEYFIPLGIKIYSGKCDDDSRSDEGWVIKPTSFQKIINNDIILLQSFINEK